MDLPPKLLLLKQKSVCGSECWGHPQPRLSKMKENYEVPFGEHQVLLFCLIPRVNQVELGIGNLGERLGHPWRGE